MAALLLRLRIAGIANRLRFGLRPAASAVVGTLVAVFVAVGVSILVSRLDDAPPGEVQALLVGGGALVLVAFAVVPFTRPAPPWGEPRRLNGYGASTDSAAVGLALAQFVGLPTLCLAIVAVGAVRAVGRDAGLVWVGVLAVVLAGVTALLLALVAGTFTASITGRRARTLSAIGAGVVAVLAIPLVVDVVRVLLPGGYRGSGFATSGLAWTPFGAAMALPGHVAAGSAGRAAADVIVAVLTLALLWLAWRTLVDRGLRLPLAPQAEDRVGLGWFDLLPGTATGSVAARSLTYWVRDARYRWSLVILPFLPLLVVPLGIAGVDWRMLALVPVPLMCLILGFLPHNDVAYDNTALWMHVSADTRGVADRLGRIAPALVIGLPLAVIGSLVAVALHADGPVVGAGSLLGAELGLSLALLLTGLGLSSLLSAALPYAAVRPGDDPFQQPQSTGSSAGWSQSLMIGGALALSSPAGVLAVLAAVDGRGDLVGSAFWAGLLTGVGTLAVGLALGALVYQRRAPELLAAALRS